MSRSKQSSQRLTVPLWGLAFIDAFCRRNLSSNELALLVDILLQADEFNADNCQAIMAKSPSIVSTAPMLGNQVLAQRLAASSNRGAHA